MAQYIDKSALVAEIERLKSEYIKHSRNKFHTKWACGVLDNILSFIDTIEVKDSNDILIEKAEKYLKTQFINDVSVLAGGAVHINFSTAIKNFVKYMKGEKT